MSAIEKTFTNGEIIIKEGDSGNTFFQILSGKVGVYKNYGKDDQVQIAILEQGQYFGEMAVIENYPRSSSVVAEGDVTVDEIAAEELNEYISQNPDKILTIMKLLGDRIKNMTDDYNEAKKILDGVRKANSSSNYDSFFANMTKQSIYLTAKNFRLERPSAESLREAAEAVSKQAAEKVITYPYGTIIFKQGEVGKCMYMVHGGIIGIYSNYGKDNEVKLTELFPVECFGEMGMISDESRSATAVALTDDTTVEIIYADDLKDLIITYPVKVDMILRHLSHRLRNLTYDYFTTCKDLYELYNK